MFFVVLLLSRNVYLDFCSIRILFYCCYLCVQSPFQIEIVFKLVFHVHMLDTTQDHLQISLLGYFIAINCYLINSVEYRISKPY